MKLKKYVLSFLFAVCLIMPVLFLTSACKEKNKIPVQYTCNVQNALGWNFYDVGTYAPEEGRMGTITTGHVDKGTSVSYDIVLRDDYDINTLKVFANETEIPLQRNPAFSTDGTIDVLNCQKAGTITVENISCDTVLTVTCSYKKVKFKFVTESGNDLTGEQRTILSDFVFEDGKSLGLLVNENLFVEDFYNEYAENGGIIFKCAKKIGYYEVDGENMVENGYFSPILTTSLNEYLIGFNESVGNVNTVVLKAEYIKVNSFTIQVSNTTALQVKATNLENNTELLPGDLGAGVSAEREIEFEFTLNKEYNVDISKAELYVFNTKIERASETADKIVWKINSKNYLPCQFLKDVELNSYKRVFDYYLNHYGLNLKGLDFTNSSLSKIFVRVDDKDFDSSKNINYFSSMEKAYYYDLQNTVYVMYDAESVNNEYEICLDFLFYEKRYGVFEIVKNGQAPVTIDVSEKLSLFENGIYKDEELGIQFRIYDLDAAVITDVKNVEEIDRYFLTFTITEGVSYEVILKA